MFVRASFLFRTQSQVVSCNQYRSSKSHPFPVSFRSHSSFSNGPRDCCPQLTTLIPIRPSATSTITLLQFQVRNVRVPPCDHSPKRRRGPGAAGLNQSAVCVLSVSAFPRGARSLVARLTRLFKAYTARICVQLTTLCLLLCFPSLRKAERKADSTV